MERQLDLMYDGAKYYGVKQEYLDYLMTLENRPRKKPSDYFQFQIPVGLTTWTMDQVAEGTGLDGKPLYFAVNGKVVEMTNIEDLKKRHPIDTKRTLENYAGR